MSSQSKNELDVWFASKDPWGYYSNPDDENRRRKIYDAISPFAPYQRALDIGAGEGFVTEILPAKRIEAIEISDMAARRMHKKIKRVHEPDGKYDLIVATGVLYDQYDWQSIRELIKAHASGIVLVSHYDKAGHRHDVFNKKIILRERFPYRDGEQILKVYQW